MIVHPTDQRHPRIQRNLSIPGRTAPTGLVPGASEGASMRVRAGSPTVVHPRVRRKRKVLRVIPDRITSDSVRDLVEAGDAPHHVRNVLLHGMPDAQTNEPAIR
jgi:hypothetical protein